MGQFCLKTNILANDVMKTHFCIFKVIVRLAYFLG